MRGYVFDSEHDETGEETLKSKVKRELVETLVKEWNKLEKQIERQAWASEEDQWTEAELREEYRNEAICLAEDKARESKSNLTEDEVLHIRKEAGERFDKEEERKLNEASDRQGVVEEMLRELGARMMRPYEHWNEDEQYMEYMENRFEY